MYRPHFCTDINLSSFSFFHEVIFNKLTFLNLNSFSTDIIWLQIQFKNTVSSSYPSLSLPFSLLSPFLPPIFYTFHSSSTSLWDNTLQINIKIKISMLHWTRSSTSNKQKPSSLVGIQTRNKHNNGMKDIFFTHIQQISKQSQITKL